MKAQCRHFPFYTPIYPRTLELRPWPEVYTIGWSSVTRRTKLAHLFYGWYFTSNFLISEVTQTVIVMIKAVDYNYMDYDYDNGKITLGQGSLLPVSPLPLWTGLVGLAGIVIYLFSLHIKCIVMTFNWSHEIKCD